MNCKIVVILILLSLIFLFDYKFKIFMINYVPFVNKYVYKTQLNKSKEYYDIIKPYLKPNTKVLDFGAATCAMSELLKKNNYEVYPLDVINQSLVKDIEPELYDGKNIPYKDWSCLNQGTYARSSF